MAHLIIRQKNGENERVVNLRRAETIVGRGPACQVRFSNQDARISHVHARITRDQSGYWIENKGKNGTGLNGRFINERTPLRQGDRVIIFDYELFFEDDPDEPLPPARFAVAARFPDHPLPLACVDGQLSAVVHFCRFACQSTLRRADLLEHTGTLLKTVFPASETVGVLLQRASAQGKLQVEVCFPQDGRSIELEPDLSVATECLESCEGLLCFRVEEAVDGDERGSSGSAIAVPLKTSETAPFGALWLAASAKCLTGQDVQLLYVLGDVLASALDNARVHEAAIADALRAGDNKIARRIQNAFLPSSAPKVNDYSFYHFYEPALSVGGDYYDYIWLPQRRLAILVADVAGKGVPAALLMSRLSAEARYCLMAHSDNLAKAIEQLNAGLGEVLGDRFVTMCICVLTPLHNRVEIACAGHEPPRILRAGSQKFDIAIDSSIAGSALGFVKGEEFFTREFSLNPGDNLLLFTDGVTDACDSNGESFGLEQLLNVPMRCLAHQQGASAGSLGQAIINEVLDHIADHSQFDDITLVCFGRDRENATDTGVITRDLAPPAG